MFVMTFVLSLVLASPAHEKHKFSIRSGEYIGYTDKCIARATQLADDYKRYVEARVPRSKVTVTWQCSRALTSPV